MWQKFLNGLERFWYGPYAKQDEPPRPTLIETIAKLDLGPNDVLVVQVDQKLTREMRERVRDAVGDVFARRQQVLVIEPGVKLKIIAGANCNVQIAPTQAEVE